jgi:dTMP kinase
MHGRFITFEGGEGAGKSTQARLLAAYLAGLGIRTRETREPGGSPFAERVRALILDPATPAHEPLAEALLFYAARADHVATVVRPALAAGTWVICDRYSDSTRVYQGLVGGLAADTLDQLEAIVVGRTTPDLTVLLDLDPAKGLARATARRQAAAGGVAAGSDAYEARDLAFHVRLRDGFLALARREPERIVVLDGAREPDAIAGDIRRVVAERLGAG